MVTAVYDRACYVLTHFTTGGFCTPDLPSHLQVIRAGKQENNLKHTEVTTLTGI